MPDTRRKQALVNQRTALLSSFERAEHFVNNYEAARDAAEVQIRLDALDAMWRELGEVQRHLTDIEDTTEGMENNLQIRASSENQYFKIKASLSSKLSSPPPTFSHAIPNAATIGLSGLKLPTITLPEFDGDYNQWLTFHDTFDALIHSNAEVPPIQKFHYLRAAVKGEAAQLIESIAISSINYSTAWETLKSRYANDYLLKKRHLQSLLECPRMKKETAAALHGVVDEFERHIKVLRQLGEPTDSWSTILEHLLCLRLDDCTLKAWEDFASTVENPDYSCLIDFLHRRIRVLESMSVNHNSVYQSSNIQHASRNSTFARTSNHAAAEIPTYHCYACNEQHLLTHCPRFNNMNAHERLTVINLHHLCQNCFRHGHLARNCRSKFSCRLCQKRHHSMIHSALFTNTPQTANPTVMHPVPFESEDVIITDPETTSTNSAVQTTNSAVQISNSAPVCNSNVLLSTISLLILDSNGKAHPARAMLDSGSQSNIISERLSQLLRLKRENVSIPMYGIGESTSNVRHSVKTTIRSRTSRYELKANFLVMPRITIDLPSTSFSTLNWKLPNNLNMADPEFNKTGPIDILLGAEHFFTIVNPGNKIQTEGHPTLINSLFGWIVSGRHQSQLVNQTTTCHVAVSDSLLEALEKFWKVEEVIERPEYSPKERKCEAHYASNVSRNSEGRYIVRLPRNENFDQVLGDSKHIALRRFQLLEKRFAVNSSLKLQYHEFLSEYLSLGHMRLVSPSENEPEQVCYLPHHPVFKESSTTTKIRVVFDGSAKTSTGNSLNDALTIGPTIQEELLSLVLRFRKYPIALVGDIAKMYRQILVHPKDTALQRIYWRFHPEEPISTYELQTVTYGLTPSSFLATRTLHQLALDEGENYPLGSTALKNDFYMDDYIGGAQTLEDAIETRCQLDNLMAKGGFQLRKYTSNNLKVLEGLEEERIGTKSTLHFDPEEAVKTLGIGWEPGSDQLRFDCTLAITTGSPTKRSILSAISKHFDPLGLTGPVVIRAKMMLQELWQEPCGWDDQVPDKIRTKWDHYCAELPKIFNFKVDRYVFLPQAFIQLHTFSDASELAYGACTYARSIDPTGRIKVCLIASKSRVTPLKRMSIPRLELSAALVGARLHRKINNAMKLSVSSSFFWSDSTVTLAWLRSTPGTWQTFVANRVAEIQDLSNGAIWNHVCGSQNPADLVSRGTSVEEFLISDLWRYGPNWLKSPECEWPSSNRPDQDDLIPERRKTVAAVQTTSAVNPFFHDQGSYLRLSRVVAYCLRFAEACRKKKSQDKSARVNRNINALTIIEIVRARKCLARLAQEDRLKAELRELRKGNPVSKQSPLRLLSPFLDSEGIIRFPSIHTVSCTVLSFKIVPRWRPCESGSDERRVLANRRTQIDSRNSMELLSLQTCCTSPGFIARRGSPTQIYSDQGKNFQGARNDLRELFEMLTKKESIEHISNSCTTLGIQWRMIPPRSPHFGGLWEAAVKVAKKHLFKQLGSSSLSFEDMATVLAQIEACMNSRPLTPMTESPDDLAILTPGHFLIGMSMSSLPDPDVTHIPANKLDHYHRLQEYVQQFWHQWKREYLQELQKESRRTVPNTEFQVGRMVVIVDDFVAPVKWPLGRIIKTIPGKDGLPRVVQLRTSKGITERAITKICMLPYESEMQPERFSSEI
ncbi:uncharacterized protein LOC129742994 [Uranotaenia lowii]|uniref:uncharacterized protein LOC129742994 n=1 Tax=Uranotaenia lowii TaxID=190385 RepID=UPI0024786837|nr:uncharacterized protein LOC129742994 [Uranotaenia lowii]